MLKNISFVISILVGLSHEATSQSINNVMASQSGSNAIIKYDFEGKPGEEYFVTLQYSSDKGTTYSPSLQKVKGDVGNNVKPGLGKQIIWEAEKEIGSINNNVIFKVTADHKKNTPEPVLLSFGTIGIIGTKKSGSNLKIEFYFIQTTNSEVAEFAFSDPPVITTFNGEQIRISSGIFGSRPFTSGMSSTLTIYNVECVKGVPVRGSLIFPYSEQGKVIPSLAIQMYKNNSEFAVFKNIPINE